MNSKRSFGRCGYHVPCYRPAKTRYYWKNLTNSQFNRCDSHAIVWEHPYLVQMTDEEIAIEEVLEK